MLRVEDIQVTFEGHTTPALTRVSFSLAPQERVAVVGPNGSGKSTLAHVLAGSIKPTSGRVLLDEGEGVVGWPSVGLLHQDPDEQLVSEVVIDEVAFGLKSLGVGADEAEARGYEELERLGIAYLVDGHTSTLSGGEKQRLALAGLTVARPPYLILDEPTSMLDSASRLSFDEIVDDLVASGAGVLVVTHYLSEMMRCDRIALMVAGSIVWSGQPNEFLEDEDLLEMAGIDELELELYRNPDHMPHLEGHGNALSGSEGDVLSLIDVEVARGEVEILQGVSIACRPGRIVLVAGRMGAGKSSALSVLSGVTKPDNGKATIGGRRVRVGDVGFVMQRAEDQLFCPTVFEDVSFGPKNAGLSDEEVEQRAAHALEQVRLHKSLWRRPVETLSGGEERLVAIAGMLAIDSDVVLFDEPTAGLDGWGRKRIREIVCELRDKGCAVVISSHDVDEWLPFADDVVLIRRGKVVFADTRDASIASAGPWVQAGLVAPAWIRAAAAAEVGDSGMRAALSSDDVRKRHEEGPLWRRPSYTRSMTGHLLSLTALVVLSVTLFFVAPNLRFVAAAVLCVVYALFNHLRKRDFLQVLKVAAIPLAFAFAGNALVVDGSGDMVLVGPVGISLAGLGRAIVASSRIYLLCLLAFAFSRTTTATDLAHMIVAPCRLFAWAGLNVERVEMVVSLTLRTIPVTIEQMIRVTQAQLIRGAALNHGPIKERISAWSSVLLPVIVSTVRHSDELTLALAERGYTDEEKPHGNT